MVYINDELGAIIIKKCCESGMSIREVIKSMLPYELDRRTKKMMKNELKANNEYLDFHFQYLDEQKKK